MVQLIHQWLTMQAELQPEAAALVMGQQRMTYRQVETASNHLAAVLKAKGCCRGDRIALLLNKSPMAIVAILGVLKADCIYVPLDVSSPPSRLAKMVASSEPGWILTSSPQGRLLSNLLQEGDFQWPIHVGWLDTGEQAYENYRAEFSLSDLRSYPDKPAENLNTPDDPAYILFTSGSTGVPKGVVVTHSNVMHFVNWANAYFGISSHDRISGHSPLHFDLSVFDIFGSLAAGAQLHLVSPEISLLPQDIAAFIRTSKLTQWFSAPSVLRYMAKFNTVKANDFPQLKRIIWCGEVLPTPVLIHLMKLLPEVSFTNLYGPTEATIACSYYTVPQCPDDYIAEIPIGTGCEGEELLVLDKELQPTLPGQVGDLYIRGVGLSPGYWRDPENTARVFLSNPYSEDSSDRIYYSGDLARTGDDGLVYFCGRADSQIKSRGYRIELGEVEAALNALPSLRECAVVAVNAGALEDTVLGAAYVPVDSTTVTAATLNNALRELVPSYMLPSRWLALDRLPCNANGKIDRPKLVEKFVLEGQLA